MRIVILINRTQKELSTENAYPQSQALLQRWLKKSRKNELASSDLWSKLWRAFDWQEVSRPQKFTVEPVRVELGMRNSVCHPLDSDNRTITSAQIDDFNEFFKNTFKLSFTDESEYILDFIQDFEFSLNKSFWPPYYSDYRVQVQAAKGQLKRHLTEMQSWCYQQESVWNAFYLWPKIDGKSINLKNQCESQNFQDLRKLHNEDSTDYVYILDSLQNIKELEAYIKSNIDIINSLVVSFPDSSLHEIEPRSIMSMWEKLKNKLS